MRGWDQFPGLSVTGAGDCLEGVTLEGVRAELPRGVSAVEDMFAIRDVRSDFDASATDAGAGAWLRSSVLARARCSVPMGLVSALEGKCRRGKLARNVPLLSWTLVESSAETRG